MAQRLRTRRPPARAATLTTWATRRAAVDRRLAQSSAAVAEAMRNAGDVAGAAVYGTEAARLTREAEATAGAWRRTLDRIAELLAAAATRRPWPVIPRIRTTTRARTTG